MFEQKPQTKHTFEMVVPEDNFDNTGILDLRVYNRSVQGDPFSNHPIPYALRGQRVTLEINVGDRMTIKWKAIPEADFPAGVCHLFEFPLVHELVDWNPDLKGRRTSFDDGNSCSARKPSDASQLAESHHDHHNHNHSHHHHNYSHHNHSHHDAYACVEWPFYKVSILAYLIELLMTRKREEMQKIEDDSGARLIHCLLIANKEQSLDLADRLFASNPSLLLDVHSKEGTQAQYEGEGSLHILAVK